MSHKSNSLKQLALQKFKKNFWGVLSFYFIVFVGFIDTIKKQGESKLVG